METECKAEKCKKVHLVSTEGLTLAVSISTLFCVCCLCVLLKRRRRKLGSPDTAGVDDQISGQPQADCSSEPGLKRDAMDPVGSAIDDADHNTARAEEHIRAEDESAVDGCKDRRADSNAIFKGEFKHVIELGMMEHWLIPTAQVEVFEPAGSGGFGVVRRGLLLGSTEIAIKFNKVDTSTAACQALLNEVQLFRRLRHPNIVLFHGVIVSGESSRNLGVVLEWVSGGDFGTHCRNRHIAGTYNAGKALPEQQLNISKDQGLLVDTARGMVYLHALVPTILHRDLKPSNILVDTVEPPRAKLTDFGLSILMESDKGVKARAGTRAYMAPEVKGKRFYNTLADVFSFGGVILFLLTAQHPPADGDVLAVAKRVADMDHLPEVLCHTACKCLQFEPSLRPSFATIFALLAATEPVSHNSGTSSTPSVFLPADAIGASKGSEAQSNVVPPPFRI